MNVRRWLTPGIGVKRWLLVVFLGLLLLAVGFAHFLRQASRDLEPGGPLGTVIDVVTLQFLPFLGSAIVPTDTMPAGMRQFAENQPFTPIIETLRGLLMGTPVGHTAVIAVGWCVGLALAGYLWARAAFNRDPSH